MLHITAFLVTFKLDFFVCLEFFVPLDNFSILKRSYINCLHSMNQEFDFGVRSGVRLDIIGTVIRTYFASLSALFLVLINNVLMHVTSFRGFLFLLPSNFLQIYSRDSQLWSAGILIKESFLPFAVSPAESRAWLFNYYIHKHSWSKKIQI